MGLTNEAKLDFWNKTWDKHGAWLNNRCFKLKLVFMIAFFFKIFYSTVQEMDILRN